MQEYVTVKKLKLRMTQFRPTSYNRPGEQISTTPSGTKITSAKNLNPRIYFTFNCIWKKFFNYLFKRDTLFLIKPVIMARPNIPIIAKPI